MDSFASNYSQRRSRVIIVSLVLTLVRLLSAPIPPDWQDYGSHRIASVHPVTNTQSGFSLIPAIESGLSFQNTLSDERSLERRGLLSGSGVAAGDVDGDGWCDLYFCGLDSDNELYRNLGNWRFAKMPATGGMDCHGTDATGAAFADIDGDDDLDLLVTASGNGIRLFLNNGSGTFRETTQTAGLASTLGSMSFALADIEGDGDLDLYVANFRPTTIMDQATTRFSGRNIDGVPTVTHINGQSTTLPAYTNRFIISTTRKIIELGQVDQLFINDGNGSFKERSFTSGHFFDETGKQLAQPPRDWGLAVQMRDFTGDGAPDIYVCNDLYTPDRIWINRGNGDFEGMPTLAVRNTSTFSMGVDFADINRDGHLDFFVVDMLSPDHRKRHVQVGLSPPSPNPIGSFETRQQILRNTLQLNLGDNTFSEISQLSGLHATDWSWGPVFLDVDLDGYEDVLVTNGQLRDFQNIDQAMRLESIRQQRQVSAQEFRQLIRGYPNLSSPNFAFRNESDLSFSDSSSFWGFNQHGISQGMALADLDNDGDLDVIQNNLLDYPHLLRNNCPAPRVRIQLDGRTPNTAGIGAKISVTGGPQPQSQHILGGGRYLSSDQAVRTFACTSPDQSVTVTVTWSNGKSTRIDDVPPNSLCTIIEGTPNITIPPQAIPTSSIRFVDFTSHLKHSHHDEPFNDLERQPLLPYRLSQPGPGLTWTDLDRDGWDDLVIGAGRGGRLGVFRNEGGKSFRAWPNRLTQIQSPRDQTTLLPWPTAPPFILLGLSNYEDASQSGDAVSLLDWNAAKVTSVVGATATSIGCLAQADLDRDGDLDLFVGGHVTPGRFPEPVDSFIFENKNGTLHHAQTLTKLGMVTGAVFSDIDSDGSPELIVTRDWDSLKIFSGTIPRLLDVTKDWHIDHLSGWWRGVTAGDFNGDGRMDLIATNWGRNHKYQASEQHPLKLYYGDLDGNGSLDLIESYLDSKTNRELPARSLRTVGRALPHVRQQVGSFARYAESDLRTIYGDLLGQTPFLHVNHLDHTLFLNQGDGFLTSSLPLAAQMAPAFGVTVADFDNDGFEDIFLSQNFFATVGGTHRYDAGRGMILRGDGSGNFHPIPNHSSGITIYGEQRAAAVADFNQDGKPDLAVTQNGGSTRLFRNDSEHRGIRVRLVGPSRNPTAIGAQLRIETSKRKGPIRELHAGSGWLSVDSPRIILAPLAPKQKLWVRWPNGSETRTPIPADTMNIEIHESGSSAP